MAEKPQETAAAYTERSTAAPTTGSGSTSPGSRRLLRSHDRRWRFASAEAAARHLGSAAGS